MTENYERNQKDWRQVSVLHLSKGQQDLMISILRRLGTLEDRITTLEHRVANRDGNNYLIVRDVADVKEQMERVMRSLRGIVLPEEEQSD